MNTKSYIDDKMILVGKRLKEFMMEQGIKQDDLAEKLGYKAGGRYISLIVTGNRSLTPKKAELIAEKFPPIRAEWLLGKDDYKTEAEKETAFARDWEKNCKIEDFYNSVIFPAFVERLEDIRGYGLSIKEDPLLGQCVIISDKEGQKVGAVSIETYKQFQTEIEHYATFLIRQIVTTEMQPLSGSGKEGVERCMALKKTVKKREN